MLNLAVSEGKIIATPVKKSKQSLKQMLEKVSRKNLHAELESGAPVGREAWERLVATFTPVATQSG